MKKKINVILEGFKSKNTFPFIRATLHDEIHDAVM